MLGDDGAAEADTCIHRLSMHLVVVISGSGEGIVIAVSLEESCGSAEL